MKARILEVPESYTRVTLQFLEKMHYYPIGSVVQSVGIGDWNKEGPAREIIRGALRRMRVIVANIREYMKLYRPEHSWLHAFTAFRLPSPLSTSDEAGSAARAAVKANLKRICEAAKLPDKALRELVDSLLPQAEKERRNGCTTRVAWGRASAMYPEKVSGRCLAELALLWKTASGNLERRFRPFRQLSCPGRARLLDTSVEDCMLVEQAPPSKLLREALSKPATGASVRPAKENAYLDNILKLHARLHRVGPTRIRLAKRRDAGVPRGPALGRPGPQTEAEFGRKRAAAITAIVSTSPTKRARMASAAPFGLSEVVRQAAEDSVRSPAVPSAGIVEKVAKREGNAKERHLKGAEAAAKARAQRELHVAQTSTQAVLARRGLQQPALKAGVMLVRLEDEEARSKALQLRFAVESDPLEFVAKVLRLPSSPQVGHVVIAPPLDTDFALSAMMAAALLGAFFATPKDFLMAEPKGLQYRAKYKISKNIFHMAVSAAIAREFPTLPQLLKAIAEAPGSGFKFYASTSALCKFCAKQIKKKTPAIKRQAFVLAHMDAQDAVDDKHKALSTQLSVTPRGFLLKCPGSQRAACPGVPVITPS